jgi:hypothetical protein
MCNDLGNVNGQFILNENVTLLFVEVKESNCCLFCEPEEIYMSCGQNSNGKIDGVCSYKC